MTRRSLSVLGLLLAVANVAHAQIIGGQIGRFQNPIAWTSVSIGWLQQQSVCDPDSDACWNFGSAPQWRATLEVPVSNGATIGVVGTTSRMPLIYDGNPLSANSCVNCDADANVSQIMAGLRLGGGTGFHQVIDINAGVTLFSNFRSKSGTRLGTGKTTQDVSFGIGYGFGYGLSPRTQIMVVQDYALIIHKRQPGSPNNTAQQSTLRFGVRVGLGDSR